tara:strand:+ start:419 stop:781 length:363 start_codon:yes stop_codon:yes gene_type:complete
MSNKKYQVAEFETDSTIWNFKEDYDVNDEMVGANLARNINNQQLKKFYQNIPVEDYEENEQWHIGFSRGKAMMLEATRGFLAELFKKSQEEIDTILISSEERPYLEVNVNGMNEMLNDEG